MTKKKEFAESGRWRRRCEDCYRVALNSTVCEDAGNGTDARAVRCDPLSTRVVALSFPGAQLTGDVRKFD